MSNTLDIQGRIKIALDGSGGWPFAHILTVSTTDPGADYPSIAAAIAAAASGDVILLDGETFTEQITINKSLTFVSLKLSGTTIANSASPTVTIDSGSVYFDGVNITNGDNGATSYAVEITDPSAVTLLNCSAITDGAAASTAGIHINTGGTPTITLRDTIAGSGADTYGILVTVGNSLLIYGGQITGTTDAINGDSSALRLFGPRISGTITWAGTNTGYYSNTTGGFILRGSGGASHYVKQASANAALTTGTIAAADLPAATESAQGAAELATQAETDAGTDNARIVTPLKLKTTPIDYFKVSKIYESDAGAAALSADATGYLSAAVQPLFSAYISADVTNVTGDGTVYQVVFDTEIFDRNSNYNNSTGVFTAPVTGKFLFLSFVRVTGLTSAHTLGSIRLVTSNRTYAPFFFNPFAVSASANATMFCQAIADMDSSDTAYIDISVFNGTKVADAGGSGAQVISVFCGYLLP